MRTTLALSLALLLAACGGGDAHDDHGGNDGDANRAADSGAHGGGHVHQAPRGGLLVVLAEETAHVELLHDPAGGRLDLHLLGAHAQTPLRSTQATIAVEFETPTGPVTLLLDAQESALSGDRVGASSHYAAIHPDLRGLERLQGRIEAVEVLGRRFEGATFDGGT